MPGSSKLTKAQIIAALAEGSGLDKKAVSSVLEALSGLIKKELGKNGPGEMTIPNLGNRVFPSKMPLPSLNPNGSAGKPASIPTPLRTQSGTRRTNAVNRLTQGQARLVLKPQGVKPRLKLPIKAAQGKASPDCLCRSSRP